MRPRRRISRAMLRSIAAARDRFRSHRAPSRPTTFGKNHRGAIVLDVRDAAAFGADHIAGAINIGLGGQFASWCGTLLPRKRRSSYRPKPLRANEAVMRLARVGIESAIGFVTRRKASDRGSAPPDQTAELHEQNYRVLRRPPPTGVLDGPRSGSAAHPLDELPAASAKSSAAVRWP